MPLLDRCGFSVSGTPGTGTVTVGSALTNIGDGAAGQLPATAGSVDGQSYTFLFIDGSSWELSACAMSSSGTVLTRTLVSSSTGSLLSLTSSAKAYQVNAVRDMNLWDFEVVTAADRSTTNLTATDIADLSVALAANCTYEFESMLLINSSSTAGSKTAVNFSAAGATVSWVMIGETSSAISNGASHALATLGSNAIATVGSGNDVAVWTRGWIKTGANTGNLTMQQAKVTSGTSIARKNSRLRVKWLGSN